MSKLQQLASSIRVWILVVFVLLSIVAINPAFDTSGVAIRQVVKDSAASRRVLENCGFTVSAEDKGFADGRGAEVEEFVLRLD